MAERFDLGGAAFHLVIDGSKFGPALTKAEADARAASQKIAAALSGVGRGGGAVIAPKIDVAPGQQAFGRLEASAKEARAAASFTATPKVDTSQAQRSVHGLGAGIKSAFALGAGVAGVTIGIAAVGQALTGSIEAAHEAQQAQRALNATYGEGAGQFTKFADAQAAALGKSNVEFKQAAVVTATLNRNYGLTADQIQTVIKRSTDLAAVQGIGIVDATSRVTSALRGEAEAAELLGLTLNSDAIKAIAQMTDEQRKNFETLDALTKAQITYREFLRQTAFAEGEAAKAAADGVTAYDQAGAAFNRLGVEAGNSIDPIGKGLAGALRDAADATAEFIRQQRQLPGWSQRATALTPPAVRGADRDIEASRAAAAEGRRIAEGKEAEQRAIRARGEAKTLGDIAKEAETAQTKTALEGIEERRRAATKAAADAREQVTDSRDAQLAESQAAQTAELRALDATAQARARARTQEDRARSDAQAAELRGLEQVHDANLKGLDEQATAIEKRRDVAVKGLDEEIRAVDRKRDIAVRGIDEEVRAIDRRRDAAIKALDEEARREDRRHTAALRNIDIERDRRLGIIDEQLKKLDDAAQRDQRRQTDLSLARSLAEARTDLSNADTPAERQRARQAIADAEAAIQRERVNRRREDARDRLRDAADQIRLAADTARKVEEARNQATTEAISARKAGVTDTAKADTDRLAEQKRVLDDQAKADTDRLQAVKVRVEEEAKIEADAIKARIDAEKTAYDQTVQAARDSFEQINRAVADSRQGEDDALAARRQTVQDSYAEDQRVIKETANVKLKALEQNLDDTTEKLDAEKKRWTAWREHVEAEIKAAILAGDPERIRRLGTSPASGENAGRGPGEPPGRDEAAIRIAGAGQAVAAGFIAEIASPESVAAAKAATEELIQTGVIDPAFDALEARSPSRVFERLAGFARDGFVQGLSGAEHTIGPAMVSAFDAAWQQYLQPWFTGEGGLQTQLGIHFGNATAGLDTEAVRAASGASMFGALQGGYEQAVIPWFTAADGVGAQLGTHFAAAAGHLNNATTQRAIGDAMHAALTAGFNLMLSRQQEWWPNFERLGENLAISIGNGFTSWWNANPLQAPTTAGFTASGGGAADFASTTSGAATPTGSLGSVGGGMLAYEGTRFGHNDVDAYLRSKGYTAGTAAYNQLFDQLFALQAQGYAPPPDMTVTGRAMGGYIKPWDWSWVGERGPELIRAGGSGLDVRSHSDSLAMVGAAAGARAGHTFNMPISIDARGVQNADQLVQRAMPRIMHAVVNFIDATERGAPDPAPPTLGGA